MNSPNLCEKTQTYSIRLSAKEKLDSCWCLYPFISKLNTNLAEKHKLSEEEHKNRFDYIENEGKKIKSAASLRKISVRRGKKEGKTEIKMWQKNITR